MGSLPKFHDDPDILVVETGNHICNAKQGNRRAAAERFVALVRAVRAGDRPWLLNEATWDGPFPDALCAGSITEESFVDLAGSARMGAGDVAILVEREAFQARTAYRDVRIGTLERVLGSYS